MIPHIQAADHQHLVFYETDFTTDSGVPNLVGPMPFPRLALNFHDYCFLHVPNGPEPADYGSTCAPLENVTFNERSSERARDATPWQPGGPPWLLTEFGATPDATDVARVTSDANAHLVGWIYWQWLYYPDPTGNQVSGLWPPRAATADLVAALSQPYSSAVAGTPTSMSFDPATSVFSLTYQPNRVIAQPTVIFIPAVRHYRGGYCAVTTGGEIVSKSQATYLLVRNLANAPSVSVSVTPGRCSS